MTTPESGATPENEPAVEGSMAPASPIAPADPTQAAGEARWAPRQREQAGPEAEAEEPETVELILPAGAGERPVVPAAASGPAAPELPVAPDHPVGHALPPASEIPVAHGLPVADELPEAGAGGLSPAHRAPRSLPGRTWWIKVAIVGLCGLLGLSLAAQLRSNQKGDAELTSARQQDLVRILDELDSRESRLRAEINELEDRKRNLGTQAQGSQTVLSDLEQREEELGILAGTVPAQGPGVQLVFRKGRSGLPADVILDAVEELRGAGAEALQISGAIGSPVRIVASTSFLDDDDGDLVLGTRRLTGPYTLLAIGDGQTMHAALAIPGGVVDSVQDTGGTVLITTPGSVSVTATTQPATPQYATPVD